MTQTKQSPISKPKDAVAWAKRAEHEVTLPSGAQVAIRLPNLPALAKAGSIPNELLKYITPKRQQDTDEEQDESVTKETLMSEADWRNFIISHMVVTPKITPEVVGDLPEEDIVMLSEFALRQRDTDAVGHQLGGLEVTAEWRKFRDEQSTLQALLGSGAVR